MKKVVSCSLVALCSVLLFASVSSAGFHGRWCTTACVPVEVTVQVPVYEDVEQTYTVCEMVPVTKEVEYTVDRGCWETYEVTVPVRKRCFARCGFRHGHRCGHGCGCAVTACGPVTACGCDTGCAGCHPCCFTTITCKRWVPNCVTETKEVTCCEPQMVEKTRTVKKFVGCEEETRTIYKRVRVKRCHTHCAVPVCGPVVDCGC